MGKMINVVAFVSETSLAQHKASPEAEREWPADVPWVQSVDPDEMLKVRIKLWYDPQSCFCY